MADAKGAQRFLKVSPTDLTSKATELTTGYPTQLMGSPLPPCLLTLSGMAAQILVGSHERLVAVVNRGAYEAQHLAERLNAAAKAYENVDAALGEQIKSGQPSGSDAPPLPPPLSASGQGPANSPSGPAGHPSDDGVPWESAVAQFDAGDQCKALLAYKESLYRLGDDLTKHGQKFSLGTVHWDGTGSEAAEIALRKHESWMYDTAESIRKLAEQVQTFADAHFDEHAKHPTAADVKKVEALLGTDEYLKANAIYQMQSDTVRQNYASRVAFTPIDFENPPTGPVSKEHLPDAKKKNTGGDGAPSGGGETPGGGGGAQPQPESPGAGGAEAQKPAGGGSPSGGGSLGRRLSERRRIA